MLVILEPREQERLKRVKASLYKLTAFNYTKDAVVYKINVVVGGLLLPAVLVPWRRVSSGPRESEILLGSPG